MKDFEYYLHEKEVRIASVNLELAKSLVQDMNSRIKDSLKLDSSQFPKIVFENLYDALRDFSDAVLAVRGYKSYSHQASIAFLQKETFSWIEVNEMDAFRYKRNGSKYYGQKIYPADAEEIKEFYFRIKIKLEKFVSEYIEMESYSFFIIHGSYGNPEENWFPWLKKELENVDYNVRIPKFPTPENQSLGNWMRLINENITEINENTIIIAHSLGPAFVLSLLEKLELKKPIKACFFVSGFIGSLGNTEFDELNKTFVDKKFKWAKIRKACNNFFLYQSDNDPYVPLDKSNELAKKLKIKPKTIKNAGHFNEKAGYKTFELLLKDIREFMKKQES